MSLSIIFTDLDGDFRNALRGPLEDLGLTAFLGRNGQEAINFAEHVQASFVLLDGLPQAGGLIACQHIRALPGYAGIPIVLSAWPDIPRFKEKAQRAGASSLLFKPLSVDRLLQEIKGFIFSDDFPPPDDTPFEGGIVESAIIWRPETYSGRRDHDSSKLIQGRLALDVYRRTPVR
ncbi:MAG: response regulator [Acetobacteraceae bacterium]|nr:response regulator [Acetobacteraceae bacterium]